MANYAVIGQSNSILGSGYVAKMNAISRHEMVSSGRVGNSTSVILPYFAYSPQFFCGAQYCIIDVCIVDCGELLGNLYDVAQMARYVNWIGHQCRSNGCEPIFILIPDVYMLDLDLTSLFFKVFNEAIYLNHYCYLDVRDVITVLSKRKSCLRRDFYSDNWHINEEVSDIISNAIDCFFNHAPIGEAHHVPFRFEMTQFDRIKPSDISIPLENRVRRESSLMQFDGVRLCPGQVITFQTGAISRVCGLMVNAANCYGKLRISGSDVVVKDLRLSTQRQGGFQARILHLKSNIFDKRGAITLAVDEQDEPTTENTAHVREQDPGFNFLEVGDMVVERGYGMSQYEARILPPEKRDLWRHFHANVI